MDRDIERSAEAQACFPKDLEKLHRKLGGGCDFQREDRYLVIKRSDLEMVKKLIHPNHIESLNVILDFVQAVRDKRCAGPLCAVVAEHDWPEYESTWQAIEKRVSGQ